MKVNNKGIFSKNAFRQKTDFFGKPERTPNLKST